MREDEIRLRSIRGSLNGPPTTRQPRLPRHELTALEKRLETASQTGDLDDCPASSVSTRAYRARILTAILDALDDEDDDDLYAFTLVNTQWRLTASELDATSAKAIMAQVRTHLQRVGIRKGGGFLIGFLDGEYEPTSGRYQLHLHGITTAENADQLRNLRTRRGYVQTATGAHPIDLRAVRNRGKQVSYCVKAFWGQRPVIRGMRVREPSRIMEPYFTHHLLWLARQSFVEMRVLINCLHRNGRIHMS